MRVGVRACESSYLTETVLLIMSLNALYFINQSKFRFDFYIRIFSFLFWGRRNVELGR